MANAPFDRLHPLQRHIHYYKDGERDGNPRETIKVLNRARDVQDALGMAILRIRQEINKLVEV